MDYNIEQKLQLVELIFEHSSVSRLPLLYNMHKSLKAEERLALLSGLMEEMEPPERASTTDLIPKVPAK